ncbi:hypothetical protein K439DRAFT_820607 [Ramaria rubella]|nr:hypothetical protein K439DRAFT_820607 [Ramaria rubella]
MNSYITRSSEPYHSKSHHTALVFGGKRDTEFIFHHFLPSSTTQGLCKETCNNTAVTTMTMLNRIGNTPAVGDTSHDHGGRRGSSKQVYEGIDQKGDISQRQRSHKKIINLHYPHMLHLPAHPISRSDTPYILLGYLHFVLNFSLSLGFLYLLFRFL